MAGSLSLLVVFGTTLSAGAAGEPSARAATPFLDDPLHLAAYLPVTTGYHAEPKQTWKVYSCDTPETERVPSANTAVSAWSKPVADWMAWVSEGRYRPVFIASGRIIGSSRLDCAEKAAATFTTAEQAARTGVIVLHDLYSPDEGGAYGQSSPAPWRLVDGRVTLPFDARPPRITLTGGGVEEEWRWALVAHEIGHTLGWNHVPYEGGSEYGNANDMMSGIKGVGTAAWNRYIAGWLDPSQVAIHRSGSTTYRLGGVGTDHLQMVVIPGTDVGILHTVSARADDEYDNADTTGVEIHRVDQSLLNAGFSCVRSGGAGACFGTSTDIAAIAPPGTADHTYGPWQLGDTTRIGAIEVTVTSIYSDGYSVTLTGTAPDLWASGAAPVDPDYTAPRPITPSAAPGPFDDVDPGEPHAVAIRWLADTGISRGCNPPANTNFCPGNPVTRGEMSAFLVRALYLDPGTDTFADTAGNVFAQDISSLATVGITRGCNPPANTNFCPDNPVTRGEMSAFLVRALHLDPGTDTFADTVASVFAQDISSLATAGITRGCNPPANTNFCPDAAITRAEMATFLYRALGD